MGRHKYESPTLLAQGETTQAGKGYKDLFLYSEPCPLPVRSGGVSKQQRACPARTPLASTLLTAHLSAPASSRPASERENQYVQNPTEMLDEKDEHC